MGPPTAIAPSLGRALVDGIRQALPAADRNPAADVLTGAGERIDALLEAMLIVSSGLDEEVTLRQIVQVATDLTGSAYGALGVVDRRGVTGTFVQVGIDDATAARIGPPPSGRGLLGVPIEQDRPIRLTDLSRHPASVGFPPHHPVMRTLLAVPIRSRGETLGRLYLSGKPGEEPFTADDEIIVQALAATAGIAIHNARLYAAARDRQARLKAIGEVTAELLAGTDTVAALRLIAARAGELTGADHTLIAVPADPPPGSATAGEMTIAVRVGLDPTDPGPERIPIAGTTVGEVFHDRTPRQVAQLADGVSGNAGPALLVPLGAGGDGVLITVRRPGAAVFGEQELALVSTFADQAAMALERADLRLARREVDLLRDRDRIAQDLHDQVIQRLFAIGLGLQSTHKREPDPRLAGRLADHMDQLHAVIEQLRSAIVELRTGPGRPPSVRGMLLDLVSEVVSDRPVTTEVRLDAALDDLPADLIQDVTAVVRAGLRHALGRPDTTEVALAATVEPARLTVAITHDGGPAPGTGPAPADPAPGGRRSLTIAASPAGATVLTWIALLR